LEGSHSGYHQWLIIYGCPESRKTHIQNEQSDQQSMRLAIEQATAAGENGDVLIEFHYIPL
jgi:hypothetical protein